MNVTREKIENRQVFLAIEMEPAEVEAALEKSYRRLVRKTPVPGFRKGKTPRAVLERYLGKESLLDDALNSLVPEAYQQAIKEQEIEPIAQPQIEITQTDPVVFKAVVSLRPTVELGDYQSIRAAPEPVVVSDDDVTAVIEQLRHQHATWEPMERPVEPGDLVVMDIQSSIDDRPYVNQPEARFQVVTDAIFPAPGFSEHLLGMAGGEEREFRLDFPSDYPRAELAGKEASFRVKVAEIKQETLPELNDDFAQAADPEFKTLDALREQVATNLRLRAEAQAKADFEDKVIAAAVGLAQVEFPPVLVEMEVDRLLNQQIRRWQTGDRGLEEYLKSVNKTEEELRDELRPLATKMVTSSLVLGEIADKEKVEVSDSEIDAEIENVIQGAGDNEKEELGKALNTPQPREAIRQSLVTRKTVQRLVAIAGSSNEGEARASGEDDAPATADG